MTATETWIELYGGLHDGARLKFPNEVPAEINFNGFWYEANGEVPARPAVEAAKFSPGVGPVVDFNGHGDLPVMPRYVLRGWPAPKAA